MIEKRRLVDLTISGNVAPKLALLERLIFKMLGRDGRFEMRDNAHNVLVPYGVAYRRLK